MAPRLAVGVLGRTVTLPPALYSLRSRHRPLWLHALFPECVVRVLATLGDMAGTAPSVGHAGPGATPWSKVDCSHLLRQETPTPSQVPCEFSPKPSAVDTVTIYR